MIKLTLFLLLLLASLSLYAIDSGSVKGVFYPAENKEAAAFYIDFWHGAEGEFKSEQEVSGIAVGHVNIRFKETETWIKPKNIELEVKAKQISTFGGTYTRANTGSADLIVSNISVSNTQVKQGDNLSINAEVANQGNASAASSDLNYYRSDDAEISPSDTKIANEYVGSLAAFSNSNKSISISINSTGTYYIGVCVSAVEGETDSTNNCSTAIKISTETTTQADSIQTAVLPNSIQINKDWGTGYCAHVSVNNNTQSEVDWQTQFTPKGVINTDNLSNAVNLTQQAGNTLTVEGLSHNNTVKAGQSLSFSYCAERQVTPNTETVLTAKVDIKDDWGEGYCAVVKVSNNTTEVVDWTTTFMPEGVISSFWNANYTLINNSVTATGRVQNNYLLAHQFTEFGFCAQRDNSDNSDRIAPTVTAPTALTGTTALKSRAFLTAFPLTIFGQASAIDDIDGTLSTKILSVNGKTARIKNKRLLLVSGRHLIVWQAEDSAGNRGIAQQQVDVLPRANFRVNQSGSEGLSLAVEVELNGDAPEYPVEIPFTLSGSATEGSDYPILSRKIVIEQLQASDNQRMPKGSITLNLTIDVDNTEGNEDIIFTMQKDNLSNAIVGKKTQHTVTILAENKPPKVSLTISQNNEKGRKVTQSGGLVRVTAQAIDPNGDNLSYTWTTAKQLSNIAETPNDDPSTFIFDPTDLPAANYDIAVAVSDGIATETVRKRRIKVKTVVFSAVGDNDTDGDSILDKDEQGDADGNGILDYLEAPHAEHELATATGAVLSGEPGTQLSLGKIAFDADNQDSSVSEAQIKQYLLDEGLPSYQEDSQYKADSIFDYIASDLETFGASTRIILALPNPLTAKSVIRKYNVTTGWSAFFEDANNSIESLIDAEGNCSDDDSRLWQAGLVVGGTCLRLTIEDGGRNDADGLANGEIDDPVAIASETETETSSGSGNSGGGNSGGSGNSGGGNSGGSSVTTTNTTTNIITDTSSTLTAQTRFNETDSNHSNYFKLAISEVLSVDASVAYTTQDGTATAGEDYKMTQGIATIPKGELSTFIKVDIIADKRAEPEENFKLIITNPIGAGFPNGITEIVATHTIVDDD